ncbi:MAG: hypothetical protein U9R15_01490 [Chloroflexota bacterium]|nr:hypothetical protein [Chloroflexota bacterium]
MVMISHNVLLDELINGSKVTTWRPDNGNPDQLWARVKRKLNAGERIIATHYWKVRVARRHKSIHYIGESRIRKIVPRTVDSITETDALLDGFTGIEYMKLALLEGTRHHPLQENYWQIYYDPRWA